MTGDIFQMISCIFASALEGLLGRRYSPDNEHRLQQEIDKSLDHVLLLRLGIDHMSGKEAIELVRSK